MLYYNFENYERSSLCLDISDMTDLKNKNFI